MHKLSVLPCCVYTVKYCADWTLRAYTYSTGRGYKSMSLIKEMHIYALSIIIYKWGQVIICKSHIKTAAT